jgi:hypothetical protein
MTKQTIAAFCSAHALPDLTRWATFEDEVTTRSVRKTLHDTFLGYGEYVEHLIYPEGLTDGWESAVFSEAEHEEIALFHRSLALLDKDCTLLDIESVEADELAMIKRLVVEWPAIIKEMRRIVNRTREAYQAKERHGPASYLG